MNLSKTVWRAGWLAVAAGGLAVVPGCIIVSSNEFPEGPNSGRVRLSRDERDSLPRIQSIADLPNVQRKYAEQIRALGPDTTIEAFRAAIPSAYFVERKSFDASTALDAYAVRLEDKYRYRSDDYGYIARDEQWFYFKNGKFVKYGAPNQWP